MSAAVELTGVERKHQYQTLIYQDPFYNRLYNRLPLTSRPSSEILVWCFFKDPRVSGSIRRGDLDLDKPYPVLVTNDANERNVVAIEYRQGNKRTNRKIRFGQASENYSASDGVLRYPQMYIESGNKKYGVLMSVTDYNMVRTALGLGAYTRAQKRNVKRTKDVNSVAGPSEPRQTRSSSRRSVAVVPSGSPLPKPMSRSPSPGVSLSDLSDFPSPGRGSPGGSQGMLVDYPNLPGAGRSRSSTPSDLEDFSPPLSPMSQLRRDFPGEFEFGRNFGKNKKVNKNSLKRLMSDLKKVKRL
jgi:hypothetical protein